MEGPLLIDAIPELAEELKILLVKSELYELVNQLPDLRIVDRCYCSQESCATFYTAARPKGAWGEGHNNVSLAAERGFLILDLVDGKIVCVEVLNKDEVKMRLDRILPLNKN